jgi:predicted NBD/HSP70 family sugar kinase
MIPLSFGKVKGLSRTVAASSPQLLRTLNARQVLQHAWQASVLTASDLMTVTGLSRATVIGVCDDLVELGWLEELGNARAGGDYRKGRPARRYMLRARAAVVVGVDAGYDRMSATVADLRGHVLGRAEVGIPAGTPESVDRLADAVTRRRLARSVFDRALAESGVDASLVLAVTIGAPSPIDAAGESPSHPTGFWQLMNPGLLEEFATCAPLVTVENDANLAAIAERSSSKGSGRDVDSYIALLVGEGIGAGLMIDRRLVRGRRGGAGEMRFLDYVDGVGSANGLALMARQWAGQAIRSGGLPPDSVLARLHPENLTEREVTDAAALGDGAASEILERLAERLARICIVLGDLLDVDCVIVGGAVTTSLPSVIDRAAALIVASGDPTAPELLPSALGLEAVGTGAVEHALALVREQALELAPRSMSPVA